MHRSQRASLPEMTMSLEDAPTKFVEASGITFAYRRLGTPHGTPLICLQHFTGTMDSWDPAVVNGLAEDRPVIVFDNTGVGRWNGKTPDCPPATLIGQNGWIEEGRVSGSS